MFAEPMFWKVIEVAEMVVRKVARATTVWGGSIFWCCLVFLIYICMYWVRRSGIELVGVIICNGLRGAEDPETGVLYKMQSSITKITKPSQAS